MPAISENQIKIIMAAITAACLYLLQQGEVPLAPIAIVAVNLVVVVLAVLNPASVSARTQGDDTTVE